ncbi:single-stranded-DNA-specific exonuclease RecJ [Candidatus Peregrinibacteria bacterium]|nr:single-stranded-DNA-specific exonuclease RecJ [Candidatus Peregrinibacteria bacterium]
MSFTGKKWIIKNCDSDSGVINKLLANRDLGTDEKRRRFFEGGLENQYDPFLLKGMRKAVERIQKAVADGQKIMVFGDYDVDGITSTVLLYSFFKKIGADADYTLPSRHDDGYGLKKHFIEEFAKKGIGLLVTVDCGTTSADEVERANQLGMDVVVTDHHTLPEELPKAFALINPKQPDCMYPNKDISGAGIAYKLVAALAPFYLQPKEASDYLFKELSLVALGLIADCVPLTGENRILAKWGLRSIKEGSNPGLMALLESAKVPVERVNSTTIGFIIGPRLNAAGRLDTPRHAFELLLGKVEKAEELSELNSRRQNILQKDLKEAKADVLKKDEMPNIIAVSNPDWHIGTIGLIAGKLTEVFHRPAIAMQDKGEELVASCRSLNDFDITAFLREVTGDLFTAFGGHKLAGGFTLPKKNLEEFLKRVETAAKEKIDISGFLPALPIDCEIAPHELTFETTKQIAKLEPFGHGNPEPTLMISGVQIQTIRPVGQTGEHLQFPVRCGDLSFPAIAFRFGQHLGKINAEDKYDIAFNLEINEWKGYKKLQMKVVDMKLSEL